MQRATDSNKTRDILRCTRW